MRRCLLAACIWAWAVSVAAQTPTLGPCPYVSPSGVQAPTAIGGVIQGANTYDFSKLADTQKYTAKIQQLVQWGFTVEIPGINSSKKQVTIKATCLGIPTTVTVPPPPPPPTSTSASPDGTAVPPAPSIIDSVGQIWTLGAPLGTAFPGVLLVMRNGVYANTYGYSLFAYGGSAYLLGGDNSWWRLDASGAQFVGPKPGTVAGPPPPPPPVPNATAKTMTLAFTVGADYVATVTRVVLSVLDAVTGVTVQTVDAGKPTPDAAGNASVPVALSLVLGTSYRPSLVACAPTEDGCSDPSVGPDFVF